MKLTPFMLFLILLFVLVLSILFSNYLPLNGKEGFVSFSKNKYPLNYIYIPQYSSSSSSVVKLYDNLFFDTKNANIIEVDGLAYISGNVVVGNTTTGNTTVGNVDNTGTSISGVYVVKRDGSVNNTPYKTAWSDSTNTSIQAIDTPESKISSITGGFNSWIYNSKSSNTDKYQLFYISWNESTYIHIIKTGTTPSHISSFLFSPGNEMEMFNYPNTQSINIGTPVADTDSNNGKFTTESLYDISRNIYQMSHVVKVDISNSSLIVKQDNPVGLNVYNRYGNKISDYTTNKSTTIPNTNFNPWLVSDGANNMVLYLPIYTKTVVAIIQMDTANTGYFKLGNVLRFSENGIESSTPPPPAKQPETPKDTSPTSDYYKWLAYWNTVTNSSLPNSTQFSNDYLLKTQIIPPVCPSCPSCPSNGVCTNCGGQGGCGAISQTGQPIVATGSGSGSETKQYDATVMGNGKFGTTANADTLGGATTIQTLGVVSGVQGLAQTGAGAVGGALNTTTDVLKSTGSGATNLIGGTIGTGADLLKSAGSGTVDLLKSTGSGAVNLLNQHSVNNQQQSGYGGYGVQQQQPGYGNQQQTGYGNQQQTGYGNQQQTGYAGQQQRGVNTVPGVDNYSYYGAVPSKSSGNFIPITTDFSAFGK